MLSFNMTDQLYVFTDNDCVVLQQQCYHADVCECIADFSLAQNEGLF